ncbi:uncharacterized protein LOC133286667 [Gastrolobium bilobum]|uniref:uncharacterized protein LOC133286667 n=1 Tax=Gastrolobium bilobum TaxID=150636 RepID=UPI002AAFF62A|nr:uncharacterized protein LOC133286667 [Gastrolobium bilobum]
MCDCDHDHWVKMAMVDDSLVANLLLRLHQPNKPTASPSLNVHWTVRQRRSRRRSLADKKTESARASPTTPLSWSAATSASADARDGGFEDSSRPTKPVDSSRSKVGDRSETATAKKSRKKRTLAELQEEERLLLKERRNLKNELASLHLAFEKQRARNESLKRMKLDLGSRRTFKIVTNSMVSDKTVFEPPEIVEAHSHPSVLVSPQTVKDKVLDDEPLICAANASSNQKDSSNQESSFLLPDLNLPAGEDFYPNVSC